MLLPKRKAAQALAPADVSCHASEKCDLCHYPDAILMSRRCGHTYHSRCVSTWPLVACPVCHESLPNVALIEMDMYSKVWTRKGTWIREEETFLTCLRNEFLRGHLPLPGNVPVRKFLAGMLNCDPMRVSKRFQNDPLGKHVFNLSSEIQITSEDVIQFDPKAHAARQDTFSHVQQDFQQGLSDAPSTRLKIQQYWMRSFIRFAFEVGQKIEGIHAPNKKTQTAILLKLKQEKLDLFPDFQAPVEPSLKLRRIESEMPQPQNVTNHIRGPPEMMGRIRYEEPLRHYTTHHDSHLPAYHARPARRSSHFDHPDRYAPRPGFLSEMHHHHRHPRNLKQHFPLPALQHLPKAKKHSHLPQEYRPRFLPPKRWAHPMHTPEAYYHAPKLVHHSHTLMPWTRVDLI